TVVAAIVGVAVDIAIAEATVVVAIEVTVAEATVGVAIEIAVAAASVEIAVPVAVPGAEIAVAVAIAVAIAASGDGLAELRIVELNRGSHGHRSHSNDGRRRKKELLHRIFS